MNQWTELWACQIWQIGLHGQWLMLQILDFRKIAAVQNDGDTKGNRGQKSRALFDPCKI